MAKKRKTRTLSNKKKSKRGCANVPVPREDVLVAGRVPKGCRFDKGGGVLCTPAMAEKAGVIAVEQAKQVPRQSKSSKKWCYSESSPHPYLKKRAKNGRKRLKKGCSKDKETGKVCCDRRVSPRRKKAVDGVDVEQVSDLGRLGFELPGGGLGDAMPQLAPSGRVGLAMLNDGVLDLPETDLAMLDESDVGDLLPPSEALPRPDDHMDSFGDFALMYLGGTLAASAGLLATHEVIDRVEYFDDKPLARAGAYMGAGAVPALGMWWLADGSEYADEIRTLAAAYGIAVSSVGLLNLIRSLLERQAAKTDDLEQREMFEDAAARVPTFGPPPVDDPTDDGEIVTDASDTEEPGTSGPYPYPHPRSRFR